MDHPESQPFHRESGEESSPYKIAVDTQGTTIEFYKDPKNEDIVRYYVRNPQDDLVEFVDSRAYSFGQVDAIEKLFNDIMKDIALRHIQLTERETETLRRRIDQEIFASSRSQDNINTH